MTVKTERMIIYGKTPYYIKVTKRTGCLKKEQMLINKQLNDHAEKIKKGERREIIRLLQEKNTNKVSSRFRYTYDEIAEKMECSSATISNIAKEEGLSRRNLQIVN